MAVRDLVDEAKNYLLLPQERPLMQGPRTRPRKPIRCGEVLFAGRFIIFQIHFGSFDSLNHNWKHSSRPKYGQSNGHGVHTGLAVLDTMIYGSPGHAK